MVVKKLITPIIEVQEKLAQVKFDAFDFVIKDFEKSSAEAIDNLKKTVQESKDKYYSDLEKQKQLIEKFDSTPLEKVPEIIKELKENNIIELVDVVGFLNKINNIQINQPEVPIIVKEDTKKVGAETIIKDDSQVSGLEEKIDEKPETTKTPTYQDLITESLPGCKASYTSIKRIISNVISNEENSFHKELGDYLNDSSSGVLHRYIKACGYTSLSKIGVINEDIMKSVVRNYITDLKSVSKVMEYIIKRKESGKKPRIKQVQELINCDVKIAHQAVLAAVEVGITQYSNKIPNPDNKIKQDKIIELSYKQLFKQAMPNYAVPLNRMSTLISKAISNNDKTLQVLIDETTDPRSSPVYENIVKNSGNFCLKTLYEKGVKPDKEVIEIVVNKYNITTPALLNISLDYINSKQSEGEKIKAYSMRRELNDDYNQNLSQPKFKNLQLACAEIGLRSVNLKNSK